MHPAQDANLSGCASHTDPWALLGMFVTEPSLCCGSWGWWKLETNQCSLLKYCIHSAFSGCSSLDFQL